ncbi:hypothetical protein JT359_12080 [Candidatus Poribacteria bacterium]|nr:hypothetical protein [Candidatus Poribacteria bacterium]
MSNKNNLLLTFSQVGVGILSSLVGCVIYIFVFRFLIWSIIINDRVSHGFLVGILLFLSIGLTYGLIIFGTSEGIRIVSRKFGIDIQFKPVFSGAFLGAPAVVGLISLLNVPWNDLQTNNLILTIILPIIKVIAYILSLPIRFWLLLNLPVELLYIAAIPIGAILGYRLSKLDDVDVSVVES